MQAMLRTDVHAAIAQDTLAAVVNRMDMAIKASLSLDLRFFRGKAHFDLGNTAAAGRRTCGILRVNCS